MNDLADMFVRQLRGLGEPRDGDPVRVQVVLEQDLSWGRWAALAGDHR